MSRNNTGNPLGSKAFLDFEDNVRNLDEFLNSREDVFNDRLGDPSLTVRGMSKAVSGDPGEIIGIVQGAVGDVVAGVDGQVDRAKDEADRAEAAADSAFVNADVYESVAAALIDTDLPVGSQFQVVEGSDLVRYRKNSSSVAAELSRILAEGVINTNRRVNALPQRDRFRPGEVIGPFRGVDGGAINVGDWHVDADGALIYEDIPTDAGSAGPRYFFDTGAFWDGTKALTAVLESELTVNRGSGAVTATRGAAILLQVSTGVFTFTLANNGTLLVTAPGNATIANRMFPELAYGYGERITLSLEVSASGAAVLRGSKGGISRFITLNLPVGTRGSVVPGLFNLYAEAVFHRFFVTSDYVSRNDLPIDAYHAIQRANLITSPGNSGVAGWAISTPSATFSASRIDGEPAFLLSHTAAASAYFDVVREAGQDILSYGIAFYSKDWAGGRAFILQYDSSGSEVASTRITIELGSGALSEVRRFSGPVQLSEFTDTVRFQVSSQGAGEGWFGEVMLAYDLDPKYRPPSDVLMIENLSQRVTTLEQAPAEAEAGAIRRALPYSLRVAALNHAIFYGQSNSIGATVANGTLALSLSQPYYNVTFAGGPRAWDGGWSYLPLKPLVEDDDDTGGSGGAGVPLGETQCSGSANYTSTLGAIRGVMPEGMVILASTAGRDSYLINQLRKGSAWYPNLIAQVSQGSGASGDYVCHFMGWIQGERDADVGTSYEDYRTMLESLQADAEEDIQSISGQSEPVPMLVSQVTAYARKNDMTARAQIDSARDSDRIFVVTSSYRFPYGGNIHFTNVGAKLNGAYFGRAHDALLQGYQPECLMPISAVLSGPVVRVRFDVPHPPMRLDTAQLAAATDYGFQVRDEQGAIDILTVEVLGPDIVITLASEPQGASSVRYALDYAGAGRSVSGGMEGVGNLRDSAPGVVSIDGADYQLFNVAPAFELPVIRLGF